MGAAAKRAQKIAAAKPAPLDVTLELVGPEVAVFSASLRAASLAASKIDARKILRYMHVSAPSPDVLRLECTDSYRLHRVDYRWRAEDPLPSNLDVLVPAAFFAKHMPRRAGLTETVLLSFNAEHITIEFDGCKYTARTLADDWPNTNNIVTSDHLGTQSSAVRGFNAKLLADIARAADLIHSWAEVRVTHLDPMKQCRFDVVGPNSVATLILMPVRILGGMRSEGTPSDQPGGGS